MGDDEDTTVTKSDHASQTLAAIYQLYQCSLLCDTTLLVAHNVTFSAHRIVLVASSEYFKCRLCTDEEKHFESIPNVSTSAMNNLLDFMYTGSLNLNQSNVWLLLAAATQLQVSAAIGLCKNFLKQQIGQKGNSETTGHNVLIGFYCDMEDPKMTVNGDNKDMLSPMGYVDKDLPEAASNKMCSKQHNHDHHPEDTQPCTFSCKSSNDTHRKETSNTIKNAGSNQPVPQVSVEEEETNRQRFDGPCSLESDNIRRESAVTEPFACVSTSDIHATVCDQALMKAEHSGKRKYVIRKKKFICKFCMKQFRYCSAKNLHVQLNHTLLSHQLRPGFSWRFMKNNIPETIQLPLPGGTVQHGCIACGAKFSLNSLYRAHFCKVHCENLKCNACIKLFQSRRLLVIHRASHKMAPAVGRMLCGHCHRPFIHRCAFEAHRCSRSHQMERRKHKNKNSEFLWVCPYCPRQFCYKKSFENHITNHKRHTGEKLPGKASSALPQKDGESSTTCRQNGRKTRRHLSRVVKQEGETGFAGRRWKCEEGCSLVLPSHAALRQHMKQHHPLVVYQCAQCHYHTQINCMIARHMRLKHSNSREKTCDICGKHFSKPSCCKIHKYLKHNVDDPTVKVYYCEVPGCKYRTCQQCNLKTHQRKHDEEKPFVCSTCGKRLKTEKNLEKHVNKVHLRIRPFICDQCGQAYGEACELDVHMARHEHEKKYKCDQCDYATHVKADYHSHMFAIHKVTVGGTYIFHCSVCDYATDRRGRMRDHENCHLGIRNFCCSQCDKRFMTRATLVEHVRCMHTPKTLHCAHCSYVSSTRRHLAEHTRVMHTYRHVRPYQCMYCDYRSSISGNCRKHCKSKHRGMPVKWVKVCDKYPERSDGLATLPGGELYTEEAGMLGDTIQTDVHNTESVEVSTTKVYLPVTLHSTLSVARPEFTSYDAQNTTYNTGQLLS